MPRENPIELPGPYPNPIRTAMHPALNHTRDHAFPDAPFCPELVACAMSSGSDALFLLERPLHPFFRMSDPLSPRLILPPWTPAPVLHRTGARSYVSAERPKTFNLASADIQLPASCKFNYPNLT